MVAGKNCNGSRITFQILAWIRNVGDETLRSKAIVLRTAVDSASVKNIEKDFEKFYFDAMVSSIQLPQVRGWEHV